MDLLYIGAIVAFTIGIHALAAVCRDLGERK